MRIDNITQAEKQSFFKTIDNFLENNNKIEYVKYLDLGVKTVKLICYSKDFIHLVEKQLNYVLSDNSDKYDTTLKIWQDDNLGEFPIKLYSKINPAMSMRLRAENLFFHKKGVNLSIFDKNYSEINPIVNNNINNFIFSAQNSETNTFYYGVKDLNPEEIIKEGHIFIQQLNRILKSDSINVVHGASIGINNNGILFCARGQRGKSTLCVLSMIKGFEYVSDDYLTIEKEDDKLYAYPIYSIITLSPRMYNELFDELKDSRFLFNNARKDKYVVSIANFHDRFKKKYPIKFCMFPEIVSDEKPSIVECSKEEKGRAIVQLIQSTVMQMQDINNHVVIKKLFDMVKDFNFYKINLCNDINENTEFLREFTKNYQDKKLNVEVDDLLIDITFDIANILDRKTYTIYTMNKISTAIYQNLLAGIKKEDIIKAFATIKNAPMSLIFDIDKLIDFLNSMGMLNNIKQTNNRAYINPEFVKECNYKISVLKFEENKTIELIK